MTKTTSSFVMGSNTQNPVDKPDRSNCWMFFQVSQFPSKSTNFCSKRANKPKFLSLKKSISAEKCNKNELFKTRKAVHTLITRLLLPEPSLASFVSFLQHLTTIEFKIGKTTLVRHYVRPI